MASYVAAQLYSNLVRLPIDRQIGFAQHFDVDQPEYGTEPDFKATIDELRSFGYDVKYNVGYDAGMGLIKHAVQFMNTAPALGRLLVAHPELRTREMAKM